MSGIGETILGALEQVAVQRRRREGDAALAAAVLDVKRYQHARFAVTYADLVAEPRYARAAEFFLTDLYGPADFSLRDQQFARIVPALVRLFSQPIVETVADLAQLHALSERLDTQMGELWLGTASGAALDGMAYGRLWRAAGEPEARERQIALMVAVGAALDRYTRNPLLRHSLRLMRGPAAAAGLGELQRFLETGFDTFRDMRGAGHFLSTIASRERGLAARLFAGGDGPALA